jgi:hypothetical protein
MLKSGTSAVTKLVLFSIVATVLVGSLAVALPLNSPENDDSEPKFAMYSDILATTELSKKNGAYVVTPGQTVYMRLLNLSDNKIMTSGTTQDGETTVLLYYSRDNKSYIISFIEVKVLNGKSEIFSWAVGDFDADLAYNPLDSDDAEIACSTTGVVMYGRISSTSVFSILRASESAPDFVGYCGPEDLISDGNDDSSDDVPNAFDELQNGFCISDTVDGNIIITDETYVNFVSCTVNGDVTITNSRVVFTNSNIEGDVDSNDSNLVFESTVVDGDLSVGDGSLRTTQTTVLGDLTCDGTDAIMVNTTVQGFTQGCIIDASTLDLNNLPIETNFSPLIIGEIGDQLADELVTLTFTVAASDADSDDVTFSLSGAPSGASIDPSTGVFTWTPTEAQGPGAYTFDVVVADNGNPLLSDHETITVTVNAHPDLDPIGNKVVDEQTLLTFTATATDPESDPLSYSLSGAPSGASIDPSTGVFTWTPTEAQGPGAYTFTVIVSDGRITDSETITVTVNEINVAPVLASIGDKTAYEQTLLTFTATATDADLPANTLTFSLSGAPSGASIDPSTGVFTWTPAAAQAPGVYTFSVIVTDNGSPVLSDSETITVTVDANDAPVLNPIGNKVVDELATLSFTATASDAESPPQTLTFSLSGAPSGASIDPSTGVFTWTPTEAQGPGSYTFTVIVTDNGSPALSDSETITVTVNEINVAPVLNAIGNKSVDELTTLTFTATATDADLPANTLTFSLSGAPSGASIDPSTGVFTWTPTEAQGPGSYTFTVIVTDNGSPALSDSETITVTVNEINVAPVLNAIGNKSVDELTTLSFTATASDADIPSNTLSYSLSGAPSGASINSSTGVFTWTPTEAQGPGNYSFSVVVTDNGTPALSDSETITVQVAEVTTITVTEGYDSYNNNELSDIDELDDVQSSDDSRYDVRGTKWGSVEFSDISFPGGAVIQSVKIYIEHHEDSGISSGELVWKAGGGTIYSPTTLISTNAPIHTGSGAETTDAFDVTSAIDTTSEVNGLVLKIENNEGDSAKRTRNDYIYVIVKYTV